MEGFFEITERYRKKHYPKGYFAMLAKRAGGMGEIILGALALLVVSDDGMSALSAALAGDEKYKSVITIGFVNILFLAFGILFLWSGIKTKWKGRAGEIRKCMEISGYSESTIEEFEAQLLKPDAIAFQTAPSSETNILTADYLMWGISSPNLVKICDIIGAYLVSLPGTFMKKTPILYIAIFSRNKNIILLKTEQDRAEYLRSLLLAKNSNIDTADGTVLSKETYETMVSEMQMRIRL